MTRELPYSTHSATVTVMGIELTVHNLNNGQRIIEADGLERLFAAMADGVEMTPDDSMKLAKGVRG